MKHTGKLFKIGLRQIAKDGMLLVLIPAPFLAGIFFKFAIPYINTILIKKFAFSIIALVWSDGRYADLSDTYVCRNDICIFAFRRER